MASEAPLILGFDTSAAQCAAALLRGDAVLARRDEAMPQGQAERLLPMLEEVLAEAGTAWGELGALAVCTGPGNFTGVRIAVAAARGLALALGVPAIGITRFEAVAAGRPGLQRVTLADGRGAFTQRVRSGEAEGPPVPADPGCPPDDGRVDPAALARLAARRLDRGAARPAPLYLRPADAAPPAEAPPRLLDDA